MEMGEEWKCLYTFHPSVPLFWQRIKEFTRYTGLGVSSMYKSQLACLSSSAFFPLDFTLLSCQSSCHLFFVFLSGRKCVQAHVPDKSISRCVYEVWLYSVWLTLKRAGAERLIFASLLIMHIHPAMLINMTAYLRRTALDQEVLLIQKSWSFS